MRSTDEAPDDVLLTTSEVAGRLRVSTDTVIRRWRAGDLAGVQLGPRTLRFRRSDVEALLAPAATDEATA